MTLRASLALVPVLSLVACGSSGDGSSGTPGAAVDPLHCATTWLADHTAATRSEPLAPSCGSSPAICCPGGVPSATCGPLVLDFTRGPGEPERLEIAQPAAGTLDVTIRARARTASPLPVTVPFAGECLLSADTAPGTFPDVNLAFVLTRSDAAPGPHLVLSSPALSRLEAADLALSGSNLGCAAASTQLGASLGSLSQSAGASLADALEAELCAACPPCGP